MSRRITASHTEVSMEAKQEEKNEEGKLIFSKYQDKSCAMLIKGTRLLAMQALEEAGSRLGAVYVGKIKNVAKNLNAYFVEIADGEVGFLDEKESQYYFTCSAYNPVSQQKSLEETSMEIPKKTLAKKIPVRKNLHQGDEILVQIKKEAHKTKQTALTSRISISNEAAAISIGASRIGYSAKLSLEKKEEIKSWLEEEGLQENNCFRFEKIWDKVQSSLNVRLNCPDNVGIVVRTQAQERDRESLLQEVSSLAEEFAELLLTSLHRTCFSCVKEAQPPFVSVFDKLVYPGEYSEIITDDRELYSQLKAYWETRDYDKNVRFYEDTMIPLTKLYSLEAKMETAFHPRVWLKSGGYLIIQQTEALTVIDVNSGKYEGKKGSFLINREAAEEIALQLRLRNLSGIIIVDFINMAEKEKQNELLAYMRSLVRGDRQRTDVVDMTPLGLVEITRKREAKTLAEQFPHRH